MVWLAWMALMGWNLIHWQVDRVSVPLWKQVRAWRLVSLGLLSLL